MSRILPPPQSPRDDTRSHTSGAGMDRRRRQRGGRPSRLATSARAVPLPRPRFSRTRQGIRPSFARTQRYNRHERPLPFHGKSIGRRHLGADTPTIERRSHLCGRPRKHPAPGTKRTPRRTGEDITPPCHYRRLHSADRGPDRAHPVSAAPVHHTLAHNGEALVAADFVGEDQGAITLAPGLDIGDLILV